MTQDSITLYINKEKAQAAGRLALINNNMVYKDFSITHGRVQWDDHSVDYGFKVSMRGYRNQHIDFL